MDKFVSLAIVVFALALVQLSLADMFFKRAPISEKSVEKFDFETHGLKKFKCVPGRTTLKFTEPEPVVEEALVNSDEDFRLRRGLRAHMNYINYEPKDEACKICVCSAAGYDEYCSRRPSVNANECLRLQKIMKELESNVPMSIDRDLSQAIRRDYVYHRDEIPYDRKAKCHRGATFYSNNPFANSTTIEQEANRTSYLSYPTKDICFACVCHTDGQSIACIPRDTYFCDYYRFLGRDDETMRDVYTYELGEDRPTYFRTLSYRMRRTMDEGVYDMIETGGDAICCDHPSGHRKGMHQAVRSRVLQNMKRNIPKENLLVQRPAMSGDYIDFVVNNDKRK